MASFDSTTFRRTLSYFPTGVTIVTAMDGDEPIGLSIGSFASVSLDPPLISFGVSATSSTWPRVEDVGRFCVNFLAADQADLSARFASAVHDRFAGVGWAAAPSGAPIIEGVTAWLDCEITQDHVAGDSVVVVGRVTELSAVRESAALVFYRGRYAAVGPAPNN